MTNRTYDDQHHEYRKEVNAEMRAREQLQMAGGLSFRIPPEVMPYQDDVRRFVEALIYKLKRNAHKGRWETKTLEEELVLLDQEVVELKEAIVGGNLVEIQLEAADVGNFALIIAAIATERGK